MEVWKDIEGYKGLYMVSITGRITSLDRSMVDTNGVVKKYKGQYIKLVKTSIRVGYYYYVRLSKNGILKNHLVARLVAQAFILNSKQKETVNHKDGNKLNNNDWNLEWNTYTENNRHAVLTGLTDIKGEKHYNAKLTDKKVRIIKHCLNFGMTGVDIIKYFPVSRSVISNIKNNKIWKHITI